MINQNAICGNCGKSYGDHYFEHQVFCFENTNGDIFTDEPNENMIMNMIEEKAPHLREVVIKEWKIKNGH